MKSNKTFFQTEVQPSAGTDGFITDRLNFVIGQALGVKVTPTSIISQSFTVEAIRLMRDTAKKGYGYNLPKTDAKYDESKKVNVHQILARLSTNEWKFDKASLLRFKVRVQELTAYIGEVSEKDATGCFDIIAETFFVNDNPYFAAALQTEMERRAIEVVAPITEVGPIAQTDEVVPVVIDEKASSAKTGKK